MDNKDTQDLTIGQVVEKVQSCSPSWSSVVAGKPTRTGFQLVVADKQLKAKAELNLEGLY